LKFRFLDATHGWATQGYDHLLHTTDGQNWVIAGTISPYVADYAFTSEKNGVYITAEKIMRTVDGGRTWNQVNSCAAKVQVNGLARDLACTWFKLQFVTPTVGYAIGSFSNVDAAFIGKTTDGGATWSIALGDVTGGPQDGFFFDEKTGYIRTGHSYDGQLYKTTDGGVTWAGGATSPGDHIRFADPQVGVASVNNKISFTTDGGAHWITREYAFPAGVNAISMPQRDRAYVVGEHGMVFRYRIVPIDYAKKGTIDAPLLPAYSVPLAHKLQEMHGQVAALKAKLSGGAAGITAPAQPAVSPGTMRFQTVSFTVPAANSASTGWSAAAEVPRNADMAADPQFSQSDAASGGFVQDTSAVPASPFVKSCCANQVQGVQTSFTSIAQQVPAFNGQFRTPPQTKLLCIAA
jgi:photosystem II stability/assembly factor-like uncharacterized protein